jgi:hypothetical protein
MMIAGDWFELYVDTCIIVSECWRTTDVTSNRTNDDIDCDDKHNDSINNDHHDHHHHYSDSTCQEEH